MARLREGRAYVNGSFADVDLSESNQTLLVLRGVFPENDHFKVIIPSQDGFMSAYAELGYRIMITLYTGAAGDLELHSIYHLV